MSACTIGSLKKITQSINWIFIYWAHYRCQASLEINLYSNSALHITEMPGWAGLNSLNTYKITRDSEERSLEAYEHNKRKSFGI